MKRFELETTRDYRATARDAVQVNTHQKAFIRKKSVLCAQALRSMRTMHAVIRFCSIGIRCSTKSMVGEIRPRGQQL